MTFLLSMFSNRTAAVYLSFFGHVIKRTTRRQISDSLGALDTEGRNAPGDPVGARKGSAMVDAVAPHQEEKRR